MKKTLKLTACLCAAMMAGSAMSVLGSADTTSAAADQADQKSVAGRTAGKAARSENVKVGKVTAVNGNEITLTLGDLGAGKRGNAGKPENGGTSGQKKKTAPAAKSGSADGTESAGTQNAASADGTKERPVGKRGGKSRSTVETTAVTLTVSDSVTVKKNGQTAAVSDITVGDVLMLGYNDSGELVSINIMKAPTGNAKPGNGTKTNGTKTKGAGRTKENSSAQTSNA